VSEQRLGVLLLSGVRHQASYAALYARHPRLRIVALADEADLPPWMDALNHNLANRLGVPYVRDVDEGVARADVDIVSVASEPTRHARLAAVGARAGKHVLVDKPLGLSVAQCREVAMAVQHSAQKLTFVHRLFSPAIQRLRAEIDAGTLGLPWAVHVSWLAAGGLAGGTVENDALVVDPQLSGGGELANFLGYPVGYIRYLTGLEVERVFAVCGNHVHAAHKTYGVEDFGVLQLQLQRGVLASITVGRLPAGACAGPGVFSVRVHGSHASMLVDEERPQVRILRAGEARTRTADGFAGEQALGALIDDFVHAIETGGDPLCGIDDAVALSAVLEAAYVSASQGQPCTVAA
jgi:myo-inositol 2-dehydrogenase/D-chiro-inositol 1-dehydrogenase